MDCIACKIEMTPEAMIRHIDTGDQRCFRCIDKSKPPMDTNKSTGSLPDKYTKPTFADLDKITTTTNAEIKTPDIAEPKKEVTDAPKETYAFPEPGDRNPTQQVAPTIYSKETPPRFKLSANDTATGKWQISVTIEGPDWQVTRSNTDSDVGSLIKEPLAAIAMSMINSMEERLKKQGKVLADDPKEPKPAKESKPPKEKKPNNVIKAVIAK